MAVALEGKLRKREPKAFLSREPVCLFLGIAAIAAVTGAGFQLHAMLSAVAFAFLILIVLLSLYCRLRTAIALAVLTVGCLDYFFTSPLFDFRVGNPEDVIRLGSFFFTALVVITLIGRMRVQHDDRVLAYERLRETQAQLERLVEANIIGIFIARLEGDNRIVKANNAFLRLLGYDRDDLAAGMTIAQLRPPETVARARQAFDEMRATGKFQPYEREFFRKDGSRAPVLVGAAVFAEDEHECVGFVVDLTERKRAESDLRQSEARLEEAQRIAHVGWWERDFRTNRVALSQEVCRVFGVEPIELPKWHERWLEVIHPEDRARAAEAAAAALRGGPRYDLEYRVVRPDGEVRIVHSQGEITWDEAGQPLRQFGILQDVTELRRAEEELRASEERFRTLVQFSFDVYWESDAQHRFVRQEFAEGLAEAPPPGSEIGKTRWEVPHVEPDEEGWRKHRRTLDAHLPFRDFEHARPTPDGGKRYVSVSGLPIFDKAGRFTGYRGVGRHITERKKAEEALRRSEAYLAEAQRLTRIGSWAWDPRRDTMIHCSDEIYRIYGEDPRDGAPTLETLTQRIDPESRDRVRESTIECVRQKKERLLDYRIALPDGTIKYIQSILRPALDADGNVVEVVGTSMDVSERRRAEEAVMAERRRFNEVLDALPAYIALLSSDYRVRFANRCFVERFGQPEDRYCYEYMFGANAPCEDCETLPILDTNVPRHWEWSAPDGRSFEISDFPFTDVDGAKLILQMRIDITARKQAEEAVRESEEQWKAVFENNPIMYFMVDATWTIVSVNPFGAEQLGYTAAELIGRSVQILCHEADRAYALRNNALCLEHPGQTRSWELRKLRKNGEAIWVRETARAVSIKNRPVVLVVSEDVSVRKRAEEALRDMQTQLAHANRVATIGQLTASIAHEVNQPIGATVTNAQAALRWMDRPTPNLDEVRQALERIVRDGDRAGAVVRRVRDLIKQAPPRNECVEINSAIREVIELVRVDTTKDGVTVETAFAERLAIVRGDRVELQQVVLNLVLNAVEAMADDEGRRELLIATESTEAGEVVVSVRDTGPGLAPEASERLFNPFYTTKPSGLGLGLSISRSIVEGHGGRLWASANAPRGAVFQFALPPDRGADAQPSGSR